jgi:predicted ester cyclase
LRGIPPTGKPGVITGISILRVANGKIAEHRLNWDTLGMLQQLGVVPPTGEGGA